MRDDIPLDPIAATLSREPPASTVRSAADFASGSAASESIDAEGPSSHDEQDLAAALAAVLARRPRRAAAPKRNSPDTQDGDESGVEGDDAVTAVVTPTSRRAFVSALRNEPTAAPSFADGTETRGGEYTASTDPHGTSAWLAATRRRSWRRAMSATGAWITTIVIGTAIVAAAAIVLLEGPHDVESWLDFTSRML